MKMKEFLRQILDGAKTVQLNIDKKECAILLSIRGHLYHIKSISYYPFTSKWKVQLVSVLSFGELKNGIKTLDNIHYLGARHTLISETSDNDIDIELLDDDDSIYEIDLKDQKIDHCQLYTYNAIVKGILYYFK